ncbi:peptidoglycan recognition family protein [Streptomyces hygroscopicus]|uniref:peptidoglycan recognition protein family protein n=1 Tax=Streptomyces hygroscopicus TaxID=1912 RepID=UPI00223F7ADC|nr:peptidoglycan recognition family protein [Streptomyces hygroscopicus]
MTPVLTSCDHPLADVPGSQASGGAASPSPGVKTRVLATSSPGRGVHRTDFPITAVGITWTGPQRGIRIRLYDKTGAPGAWQMVSAGCPCGKDPKDALVKTSAPSRALVPGRGSFGYQIDAPSQADIVNATAVDAGLGPSPDAPGDGSPTHVSATPTVKPSPAFPPENFVSRAGWGADESKRFLPNGKESSPTRFFPLQALTVHHTVTANDDPNPAATVRAIYELHAVGNDWGDIGYHFLVDHNGRIYEGRWSGNDGIPAHDKDGKVVTAFHTIGFNSGNLGIALLGDFRTGRPSPAMRRSLTQLLASLADKHGLDPQAGIAYRNPVNGKRKQARTLNGHRDWIPTECPGTTAYLGLEAIRADVARLLKSAGR